MPPGLNTSPCRSRWTTVVSSLTMSPARSRGTLRSSLVPYLPVASALAPLLARSSLRCSLAVGSRRCDAHAPVRSRPTQLLQRLPEQDGDVHGTVDGDLFVGDRGQGAEGGVGLAAGPAEADQRGGE